MKSSAELMKRCLLLMLVGFIFFAGNIRAGAVFDQDVEILESDASGVTFRYLPSQAALAPFETGGRQYFTLQIPRTAQNGKDGEVEIPVKIVPLAVPPGARPVLRVIALEYHEIEYKEIAPYYSRPNLESYIQAYQAARAETQAISSNAPYIAGIDEIRGLIVARIAIPTAQYSKSPQRLALLTTATIRVDFAGSDTRAVAGYRYPGQAFDRILKSTIANYEMGQNWFLSRPASTLSTTSVFDSATTWIRIEMISEGIYGFGWTHFNAAGVNPADVDISRIRVFYGGGRELPIDNSVPRPELVEIPVKIIGGGDGSFDNGDLVVFYADAVDSWEYSQQFHRFQSIRNRYTDKNVYWLTVDGNFGSPARRIGTSNGAPSGPYDVSVDNYTALFHREQEKVFRDAVFGIDYGDWYWGNSMVFTTSIQLFDLIEGVEARVVARHQGGRPELTINGIGPDTTTPNQTYSTFRTRNLANGANNIELQSLSNFYLDYIDIEYRRWLKAVDGNLLFSQPDTFGTIRYTVTEVTSPYLLLSIADRRNPVEITGGTLNGTTLTFQDTISDLSHKRYYLSAITRFKTPGAVTLYERDNLRDVAAPENLADMVIVTYDGFRQQADRFAQHRRETYGLATRVVNITEIYNQFSQGLVDPTAIRDFLKYTYENWREPAPSYAFLIGDGNYDFRNNLGNNVRNYIPPFENTHLMSDEHFIYFGRLGDIDADSNSMSDMAIGRINARSAQEVEDFITKTIEYDSNPELGPWRNRIVVVADDNLHLTPHGWDSNEFLHTGQGEDLANRHVPGKFETNKIYLIDYLMQAGYQKPEARETIIGAFNQGALIVNYIGHGSANLWADERVFRRIEDIPRLNNGKRMSLVFTASCSIGKFDFPLVECMAEDLMRGRTHGTISVISATREVYAQPNAQLNNELFDQFLFNDSMGVGQALYMAKFLRSLQNGGYVFDNDKLFMVFGDPSQILQYPKFKARPILAPDSLVALTVDSIAGEIVDDHGNLRSDFSGNIWITVKDGTVLRSVTARNHMNIPLPPPNIISYTAPGATIFIGPADVQGGRFSTRFFIPKDVTYGSRGAKIYAYAENGQLDALGVVDSILISGSLPTIQDSIGPTIALFADGRPFRAGATMVTSNFALGAEIRDEHGINITGQLGHSIVVSVDDGGSYEADVTGYFRFNQGDYQGGRLEFVLPQLPLGEHTLSLKAWDNFNNSTMVTRSIEVVADGELQITEVMNYPNPVRRGDGGTAFQYRLSGDVDKVTIKIFTEAGRKIKSLELTASNQTQMDYNQVSWNLLDADGDHLANGIYLYQVNAERRTGDGGKESASETGKLVILR